MLRTNEKDSEGDRRRQHILGRRVCSHAFRKLLGLGANRFRRLSQAARRGDRVAPIDKRTAPQRGSFDKRNAQHLNKRAVICEFLAEIRSTLSEPMPTANQATSVRMIGTGASGDKVAVEQSTAGQEPGLLPSKFRRHRGRRPKAASRIHRGSDLSEMRVLPPGSLTDYLRLLQAKRTDLKFSLKLFSHEPWQRFDLLVVVKWGSCG